ncbi:MAG: gamma-glutamylcyclotransferase family protein [Beijerinckiaceae bacterium]
MPLYFAYGANMDAAAMARRCPASRSLGVARLPRHRLFITAEGYASLARAPRDNVFGVVWNLALADVQKLDRFEGVDRGLYRKGFVTVIVGNGRSMRAMIYVGGAQQPGVPLPGYVDVLIAAADHWELPAPYRSMIANLAAKGVQPGPTFQN